MSSISPGWKPEPGEILSVDELLKSVRNALESFFTDVWVEGEVSGLRIPGSGHAYFTLLGKKGQLKCVAFRNTMRYFSAPLKEGEEVMVRGRLSVYEPRGDVQLIVEELEPLGAGLARLAFEALKKKLAGEGLFDEERKRPLPVLPTGVGVVTSPSGAAVRDILSVLGRRAPWVNIFIAPAQVQGEGAASQLVSALELAQAHPDVDVIIIGRGGGASEDLSAFNDEQLVRRVGASRIPVISAVGHEIDFTLLDFAADARGATPSAAAEMAVRESGHWVNRLEGFEARLSGFMGEKLAEAKRELDRLDPWRASPERALETTRYALMGLSSELEEGARTRLERGRARREELLRMLLALEPGHRLAVSREAAVGLETVLFQLIGNRLAGSAEVLGRLEGKLGPLSPYNVLDRGYAIVRTPEGEVLRDAGAMIKGERIEVKLRRGGLGAVVDSVYAGDSDTTER